MKLSQKMFFPLKNFLQKMPNSDEYRKRTVMLMEKAGAKVFPSLLQPVATSDESLIENETTTITASETPSTKEATN